MAGATRAKFWAGKRILLTGHTGFKGSWLTLWLHKLGAKVTGLSLAPDTSPNLYTLAKIEQLCESHFCDIRERVAVTSLIKQVRPDIVFHLAAQPLIRASYREPVATFATNVMGTVHVLDALRKSDSCRVAVVVTTDKVYRNEGEFKPYCENDALGGHDPYSASKAASEIVIASYRDSYLTEQGVAIASARAGNVIGGGDWSEDRLIPDAVRAWQSQKPLEIRRPDAIRPWQHVLEPLAGYMVLAESLWQQPDLAGAYNFGPESSEVATVREVVEMARKAYGKGKVHYGATDTGPHEEGWLALDVTRVAYTLGVKSRWTLSEAVEKTMVWYRAQYEGKEARMICESQIDVYESLT